MLTFSCVMVILAVGYAHHREGLFTAMTMTINIFLAGLLAFEVWEPLANLLGGMFDGGMMEGTEDFFVLTLLFCILLALLRWATHSLAFSEFHLEPNLNRFGGGLVGLVNGFMIAGFLVVVMQTIPFYEDFMGFTPRGAPDEGALRTFIPPDRAWLALMRHPGAHGLRWYDSKTPDAESNYDRFHTFDPHGTFEIRYIRYRRNTDKREKPMTYQGEFDKELGK